MVYEGINYLSHHDEKRIEEKKQMNSLKTKLREADKIVSPEMITFFNLHSGRVKIHWRMLELLKIFLSTGQAVLHRKSWRLHQSSWGWYTFHQVQGLQIPGKQSRLPQRSDLIICPRSRIFCLVKCLRWNSTATTLSTEKKCWSVGCLRRSNTKTSSN